VILVAVGTQFPFDRMVRAVDGWAAAAGRNDVVAQIGPSTYQPRTLRCVGMIPPDAFAELQQEAELIIAHAGMGSILGALEASTPIIIMPRVHALGEHRNDHQLATARRFADVAGVHVARDEGDLREKLEHLDDLMRTGGAISTGAPEDFTDRLRMFVKDTSRRRWLRRRAVTGKSDV
jgi:UDP-N-acetylglucosamine transferase subunit ALG13